MVASNTLFIPSLSASFKASSYASGHDNATANLSANVWHNVTPAALSASKNVRSENAAFKSDKGGTFVVTGDAGAWNISVSEAWVYTAIFKRAVNGAETEIARTRARTIEVDGTGNKTGDAMSVTCIVELAVNEGVRVKYHSSQSAQLVARGLTMHSLDMEIVGAAKGAEFVSVTQVAYDALTPAEKADADKLYLISA